MGHYECKKCNQVYEDCDCSKQPEQNLNGFRKIIHFTINRAVQDGNSNCIGIICSKDKIKKLSMMFKEEFDKFPDWFLKIDKYLQSRIKWSTIGQEYNIITFVTDQKYLRGLGLDTVYVFDNKKYDAIYPVVKARKSGCILVFNDETLQTFL